MPVWGMEAGIRPTRRQQFIGYLGNSRAVPWLALIVASIVLGTLLFLPVLFVVWLIESRPLIDLWVGDGLFTWHALLIIVACVTIRAVAVVIDDLMKATARP